MVTHYPISANFENEDFVRKKIEISNLLNFGSNIRKLVVENMGTVRVKWWSVAPLIITVYFMSKITKKITEDFCLWHCSYSCFCHSAKAFRFAASDIFHTFWSLRENILFTFIVISYTLSHDFFLQEQIFYNRLCKKLIIQMRVILV